LIAFFVVTNLVVYYMFYAFLLDGRAVVGTVLDREVYTTQERHGTSTHYRILVGLEDAQTWMSVTHEGYSRALQGERVAAIETPDRRLSLGSGPGVELLATVYPPTLGAPVGLLVWLIRRRRLLWWEQKRVVTSGTGALRV
jgi:hypothetical protein